MQMDEDIAMLKGPRLVVVPALPVAQSGDRFILTRKFISGIRRVPAPLARPGSGGDGTGTERV